MNITMKTLILSVAVALAAFGQPVTVYTAVSAPLIGTTTLSGAINSNQTIACVASATGIVTPSIGATGSYLLMNKEAVQIVSAGPTSTCYRVKRGVLGSVAQQHMNGIALWIANPTTSSGDTSRPLAAGTLFPLEDASPPPLPTVQPAFGTTPSVAAPVAGSIYWSQIQVEHSRPVTGACVLNGATVGTDKWILALYDYAGNLIGNSALAGTTTAGASLYQCLPFTTAIEISGTRSYYLAIQSNSTTDLFKKYITGEVGLSFQAGSTTGTFGTIPATLAIPSTFTTAVGPIGALY